MNKLDESNGLLGPQLYPHEGQLFTVKIADSEFQRIPIKTRLALIDENLVDFIKEALSTVEIKSSDLFFISSKVVSITRGYYRKESEIHISFLAKFLVRFVKKLPNDPGFALPQKLQMALDIVGLPRFLFAVIGGAVMKFIFRKPGYFYKLAGKNIGGIDGFVPWMYPEPLRGYGYYTPPNPKDDANYIEKELNLPFGILDGNNVEQILLGYGDLFKQRVEKLYESIYGYQCKNKASLDNFVLEITQGNPQGQSGNTPILLVRHV